MDLIIGVGLPLKRIQRALAHTCIIIIVLQLMSISIEVSQHSVAGNTTMTFTTTSYDCYLRSLSIVLHLILYICIYKLPQTPPANMSYFKFLTQYSVPHSV